MIKSDVLSSITYLSPEAQRVLMNVEDPCDAIDILLSWQEEQAERIMRSANILRVGAVTSGSTPDQD
jgi:hypothetical protein